MDLKELPRFILKIDEDDSDSTGVDMISFVENPAIEIDFVTLSNEVKQEFKISNKKKQYLTGPALIPNKLIYREYQGIPYTVYFDKDTIEKIVRKFFRNGHNNFTNEEHSELLEGNYIIESWIITDKVNDKSKSLGFKGLPNGTWMVTYHVSDKKYWDEKIETGEVKGFSIEGIFKHIEDTQEFQEMMKEKMESYTDYPQAASDNAARALKYRDENDTDCGTQVGWTRANQLANREPISEETIKRMAAFVRHEQNKDVPYDEGCGGLMWDAWGGDEGIAWASRKIDQIEREKMSKEISKEDKINIIMKIKKLLGLSSEEVSTVVEAPETKEQKFVEYISENGTKLFVDEEDMKVYVVEITEEGEENWIPFEGDAEVTVEDGKVLVIVDGVLTEIREPEMEEETEEEVVEEDMAEEEVEASEEEVIEVSEEEDKFSAIEKNQEESASKIEELTSTIVELQKTVEELSTKLAIIAKEPASEPVSTSSKNDIQFSKDFENLSPRMQKIMKMSNRKNNK